MDKRRISVESVRAGVANQQVHVVVWEKQEVQGQETDTPIGERFISFSASITPEDMLPEIEKAAEDIEAMAEKAKETRQALNELLGRRDKK